MTKKLLAFILTFSLLLSVVSVGFVATVAAEGEIQVWDGSVSASLQGSGTKTDPYLITNGADLAYMYRTVQDSGSSFSNGKYFKLTADIYLNDTTDPDWLDNEPKAWYSSTYTNGYRFTGNFDGDGHTVYGLYYNGEANYIGLLPVADAYSYDITVKNITVSDSFLATTGKYAAAIIPNVYNTNSKTVSFYNVCVTDTVNILATENVAGIVGGASDSSFYQYYGCAVLGNISSGYALVGNKTSTAKIVQSYTTATCWYKDQATTSNEAYIVSADAIKGAEAAKAAMPGLDFDKVFTCTEDGYPTPVGFDVGNVKGTVWTGLTAPSYASGSGTKADPYIIETAEQLAKLVKDTSTSGKYYELAADIIVNDTSAENWTETATPWFTYNSGAEFSTFYFKGTLNGDFHTIKGLYHSGSDYYVGLFAAVDGATINRVFIDNSYLVTEDMVSAFAGYVPGSVTYNECVVGENVTISGSHASGFGSYGGGNATINNCAVLTNITGTNAAAFLVDLWGGTRVVKGSFGIGKLATKKALSTSTNNYATEEGNSANVVTLEQMKGIDALTNMPLLTGYFATEGFPVRYNNGVKGEAWSGGVAKEYAGGNGTEANPYIIETAEQLARLIFDKHTAGKFYKLGADIKINDTSAEDWTATAKSWYAYANLDENKFRGTLDGALHTISGLYYNGTGYAALMPGVEGTVLVKNLYMKNSSVNNTGSDSNSHNAAAFISRADFSNTNITFDACFVDDTVTLTSAKSAAAFVGYGTATVTVKNSGVAAVINAGRRPGAFISDFWGSGKLTISNSYAAGTKISGNISYTATNCYSSEESTTGVTQVAAADMKGENAVINMPNLFCMGVTAGYPVYYQQGTAGKAWTGSVAYSYAGGAGTKANPYIIETAEQLVKLVTEQSANTKGKYYTITKDIIINDTTAENWKETAKPWFTYNSGATTFAVAFQGVLNGENNTISGLYYNGTNSYVGLFGSTGYSGVNGVAINNVIVDNSYLETTGTSASVFTGYVYGPITYTGCVVGENVTVKAKHATGYGSYGSALVTINSCASFLSAEGSSHEGAFLGDVWSYTHKISNSIGIEKFSGKAGFTSTNNYGTVEDGKVNVVTVDQMKGIDALTNMPGLTGYFVTESFPVRYFVGITGAAWSGAVAEEFAAGTGTKADPYVILTAEQLARMLNTASKNNHYILGTDIVLSDDETKNNWLDSSNSLPFSGNFNGNGFVISGLYYDKTVTSGVNVGLIPVADSAYISSVILEDSNVKVVTNATADTYVGALVGYVQGNRTTLYTCYVAEDVAVSNTRGTGVTANNSVGGFIGGGYAAPVTIDGSAFFGTIAANEYRHGALFGNIWGGVEADRTVKNTITDANMTPSSYWSFVGEKNVSTVASAKDITSSFTVVDTLKGEEGFAAVDSIANWNDRYFGTEGYPMLSSLAQRYGDVNCDATFDQSDIEMVRKYLIGASVLGYVDVNRDGEKDIRDLVKAQIKITSASKPGGYELVWYDEFDGTKLDETKWSTQTRMSDTSELAQSNMTSVRKVAEGNLQLTAMENPYYNPDGSYFEQHQYMTSGSVTTEGKMSYQYGYLEIRAKVPFAQGVWPSFWLRSHQATGKQENPKYEVEVDVFEVFGSENTLASNLHQQNYDGKSYQTGGTFWNDINQKEEHTFANAENLSNEYHTYAFEWEPDRMAIYVDGVLNVEWKLDTISLWTMDLKTNTTGFNTTMNILFNNHLFTESSNYIPSTGTIENAEGNLPAEFDIDYVRLYQKNDGVSKLIIGE